MHLHHLKQLIIWSLRFKLIWNWTEQTQSYYITSAIKKPIFDIPVPSIWIWFLVPAVIITRIKLSHVKPDLIRLYRSVKACNLLVWSGYLDQLTFLDLFQIKVVKIPQELAKSEPIWSRSQTSKRKTKKHILTNSRITDD